MIEKHFLFPECFVAKIPMCDECKVQLVDNNIMLPTAPPKWQFTCPKCNKEYAFYSNELKGEWKWRTI